MESMWRDVIPKWFQPYQHAEDNDERCNVKASGKGVGVGTIVYSGGGNTKDASTLRTIIVYANGFDTHRFEDFHHFEHGTVAVTSDPLKRFWGKLLAIDEDHLVLMDETFAPTLIPWNKVRYIEVV